MEQNTWEHPFTSGDKTEPVQSFEAFQIWLEMGNKRSLKAVAERVEKSHDTIKKYSCTWKWSERLQDKLSYENQQIHSKQLEAVMTSLDIDTKRDIYLQDVLGNLIYDIRVLSEMKMDKWKAVHNGKMDTNLFFEMMERLINMYGKLEKIHGENQQKFIDMNAQCLHSHSFEKQEDYPKMLRHGKEQQLKLKHNFNKNKLQLEKDGYYDPSLYNVAGEVLSTTPHLKPVEKYKSIPSDLTESETAQGIPEHKHDQLE